MSSLSQKTPGCHEITVEFKFVSYTLVVRFGLALLDAFWGLDMYVCVIVVLRWQRPRGVLLPYHGSIIDDAVD
jgi:hypothetical protein